MTNQHVPSKSELLQALRTSAEEVMATLRTLPAERFEQGRYESGWNGRQILAHVAAIEWTYRRLLEIPTQAPASDAPPGDPPTRTALGGIDAYNQRQVEKRAQASVEDLLTEFEANRKLTIAAVEEASEDLLAMPIRSAGGVTGPLAAVVNAVAVLHVRGHVRDIVGE
jgi:uncharacterized damage-inducible protein DinB